MRYIQAYECISYSRVIPFALTKDFIVQPVILLGVFDLNAAVLNGKHHIFADHYVRPIPARLPSSNTLKYEQLRSAGCCRFCPVVGVEITRGRGTVAVVVSVSCNEIEEELFVT